MSKSLKDRLKAEMERRNVKFPQLAKETGISKEKMYKWYQNNIEPQSSDATILETWITGAKKLPEVTPMTMHPVGADKMDFVLSLLTQIAQGVQAGNHKLSGLEQMQIVASAMNDEYARYFVSALNKEVDAEAQIQALQRKAFEKLMYKRTKGKTDYAHT